MTQRIGRIVPPPTPVRSYIHNPPVIVQQITTGHIFRQPTLAISVPKWMVKPLRSLRLRVLE